MYVGKVCIWELKISFQIAAKQTMNTSQALYNSIEYGSSWCTVTALRNCQGFVFENILDDKILSPKGADQSHMLSSCFKQKSKSPFLAQGTLDIHVF